MEAEVDTVLIGSDQEDTAGVDTFLPAIAEINCFYVVWDGGGKVLGLILE